MTLKNISLADFEIHKIIAVGGTSQCFLAKHLATGNFCCVKKMMKRKLIDENQVSLIISEKKILEKIDHPLILRFYGAFQDENFLYIITEFIGGGDLWGHIHSNEGYFDYNTTRFYAAEVLVILDYLHKIGIVYRDLKPENILVDDDGHLKLIDMGYAKDIQGNRTCSLCGTPDYLAPEVIRGESYGFSVDWWAFGVLVCEMATGMSAFADENEAESYRKIREGEYTLPEWLEQYEDLCHLIRNLLCTEVAYRLGCSYQGGDEIKNHPFFEGIDWEMIAMKIYQPPIQPYIDEPDEDGYPSLTNYIDYSDTPEDEVPDGDPIDHSLFAEF